MRRFFLKTVLNNLKLKFKRSIDIFLILDDIKANI